MLIKFEVILDGERTVTEADLAADLERLRPELLERAGADGRLHFEGASNGATLTLTDSLEPLIFQVCLDPVGKLAAGEPVTVRWFSAEAKVEIVPEGDEIVFNFEAAPSVRFHSRELLPALVECAARYFAFQHALRAQDPE